MKTDSQSNIDLDAELVEELQHLQAFDGPPVEFWREYIRVCTHLIEAESGFLMIQDEAENKWRTFCVWPPGSHVTIRRADVSSVIRQVSDLSLQEGQAWDRCRNQLVLGVRLDFEAEERPCAAVFVGPGHGEADPREALLKLKISAGIPRLYQVRREKEQARNDVLGFVETLDFMVLLNAETRFLSAAMTLCNEVNSRFDCSRVSLGWLKRGYIRVQAISHMERFEKKMDAVQILESAMEECFDQDEEIVIPKASGQYAVTKDHERFALGQGVRAMLSLPVRLKGEPAGVLTCERETDTFTESDVNALRLIGDQAVQRLDDLRRADRWIGAKAAGAARDGLEKLLGVEHTFLKLLGLVVLGLLLFGMFGTWPYRIEAPFILKTDDLAYIPAPFDGYIHGVHVQVGDRVKRNDPLLTLDDQELLLEESSAIADRTRFAREAKKSGARDDLAEMRIAEALKGQSEARLDLIRYHLSNSELRAPFSGIVVEGEMKELLGAPVRKGDVLFKVAQIEKIYAVLDVDEKDVHEVALHQSGELAFISRPELKFPIEVKLVEPVAVTKEEGNVFQVQCVFKEGAEGWWRPGMSGIAKIDAGKRNVLWILTHRTVDFFRLLLWW